MVMAESLERHRERQTPVAQFTALEETLGAVHAEVQMALRDAAHPITSVMGLILARLGQREMTVTDLISKGCYGGSNVSYNVRKLCDLGYLSQIKNPHDARQVLVRATPSGLEAAGLVSATVARSQHIINVRILG